VENSVPRSPEIPVLGFFLKNPPRFIRSPAMLEPWPGLDG
jgi:hypothetical protein